jgi:hypothetical protein
MNWIVSSTTKRSYVIIVLKVYMSNVKLLSLCKYQDDGVLAFHSHEKKPLTFLAFAN